MKPQFLTELDVRVVPNGYTVLASFKYYSAILDKIIDVPNGFFTNFASIPRVARVFITGHGDDRKACVIHDFLYHIGFDRKLADAVLLEALEAEKVNWFKRRLMYRAVRTGGWMFYEKADAGNNGVADDGLRGD